MDNPLELVINKCIINNIPFVVFQKPYEQDLTFFSNPSDCQFLRNNSTYFSIVDFNSKISNGFKIFAELDTKQTLDYCNNCQSFHSPSKNILCQESTQLNDYVTQVNYILDELHREGGKVVLSKVTCGQHNLTNFYNLITKYFSLFENSFRYLYYTPKTGCWIGASPEILLKFDANSHILHTMSLAGTRTYDKENGPWDLKNIEEHNYVTQYIVNQLLKFDLDVKVSREESLKYGDIEHLCHRISATGVSIEQIENILDELNPTPALAGYPLKNALDTIFALERHERKCYGGYVSIWDKNNVDAYVNIRCANFDTKHFCIYSGSGLTKDSISTEEWEETENKIKRLKELFI